MKDQHTDGRVKGPLLTGWLPYVEYGFGDFASDLGYLYIGCRQMRKDSVYLVFSRLRPSKLYRKWRIKMAA